MKSVNLARSFNQQIKVLEVIGGAGLGGMENYLKNFIACLPSQFKVTCVCPCESPFTASLRRIGVEEVYITPVQDDPAWRSIQLVTEVAKMHEIDIFHAHMPKAHLLAGLAGKLVHKPVVATVHGMNVTSQELGITRSVESHLITNCQEAYMQAFAMGVPADRVNIVRNGVDTEIFKPNNNGNELRNAFKIPNGAPLVGFVGRLEHEKGPDLFLRAAHYVSRELPDVHFVITGEGLMRNELEVMCAQLGLQQRVHFTGWRENTAETYQAIDLLAHTSRSDGTSLVLLEAMACGCPAVGIAVGGVREIIEHETTGFLEGEGDWEGVAFRLLQLLQRPERLQSMRMPARERIKQYFDLKTNTRRTAEIIHDIAFSTVNNLQSSKVQLLSGVLESKASMERVPG